MRYEQLLNLVIPAVESSSLRRPGWEKVHQVLLKILPTDRHLRNFLAANPDVQDAYYSQVKNLGDLEKSQYGSRLMHLSDLVWDDISDLIPDRPHQKTRIKPKLTWEDIEPYIVASIRYTWDWDRIPEDIYDRCPTSNYISADAFDEVSVDELTYPLSGVRDLKTQLAGNGLSVQCQKWLRIEFLIQLEKDTPDEILDHPDLEVPYDEPVFIPIDELLRIGVRSSEDLKKRAVKILMQG